MAALQQQRCQLVRDAEALRGQANDAVMRGVHALVQTVLAATPLPAGSPQSSRPRTITNLEVNLGLGRLRWSSQSAGSVTSVLPFGSIAGIRPKIAEKCLSHFKRQMIY